MPIDYEQEWPKLVPGWCQQEIDKHNAELGDNKTDPSRKGQLQHQIAMLERIKADYEGGKTFLGS